MAEPLRLIDHLRACNRHDPRSYRPLSLAGRPIGLVRHDHARRLVEDASALRADPAGSGLAFVPALETADADARTAALDRVVDRLIAAGHLPARRGEPYAAQPGWGQPAAFRVDRAHVAVFGIRAYGQHVNGLVALPGGSIGVWIGERATDRLVAPGQLDNMVAGGLPDGLTLAENLAKEGGEEAGLSAERMAEARPVGVIRYRLDSALGLRDDVLFVYDLWLDGSVEPANRDGEVARFSRWRIEDVAPALTEPGRFKFNVALVLIDLLVRQGMVKPDDPHYPELAGGLGGPAAWDLPGAGLAE